MPVVGVGDAAPTTRKQGTSDVSRACCKADGFTIHAFNAH